MGLRSVSVPLALVFVAALGSPDAALTEESSSGVARSLPSPPPAPFGPPNNGIHVACGSSFSSEASKGKQKSAARRRALRYG